MPQSSLHTKPTSRKTCGVRHKIFTTIALLVVAVWAVIALRAITFAQGDEPEPVDAVYVLGPVSHHRLATGMDLIAAGYSDHLVITTGGGYGPAEELCQQRTAENVHCVVPDPMTTAGEAQSFAHLAAEHDWESVMVVTTRTHLTRATYYFEQCVDGNVVMIDEGQEIAGQPQIYRFVYENAAFIKAWLSNTCQ